jgi:hypothetical protein
VPQAGKGDDGRCVDDDRPFSRGHGRRRDRARPGRR